MRTGGRWFDPRFSQYSFRGLMMVTATGLTPLNAVHCFDDGYVGKQPVAWKEYCVVYWLKELQESMERCTGARNILLKMPLNTITINQSKGLLTTLRKETFDLALKVIGIAL